MEQAAIDDAEQQDEDALLSVIQNGPSTERR